MGRICVVTRSEIISGEVESGNRIGNLINEPFRTYGYEPEQFMKINQGKKFQSFLMTGEILRYNRYSGYIRRTMNKSLIIPFGVVEFIYGVGKDQYKANKLKQLQNKFGKALDQHIFKFRLKFILGRFELEGDCELGPSCYVLNQKTGKKEITGFKEDFMTLENAKILSVNKKLGSFNATNSSSSKYFEIAGFKFDIIEDDNQQIHPANKKPSRISDSYFGLNPITPFIISTKERLIGPYSYREL